MKLAGTLIELLICLIPFMVLMAVVAVIGTRSKMKYANQIHENIRQGKYTNLPVKTKSKIRVISTIQLTIVMLISLVVACTVLLAYSNFHPRLSDDVILFLYAGFFFLALIVLGICAYVMERIMKDPK